MSIWVYTLGSTLLISLLALVGILALYVRGERLNSLLLPLVGFAAGALLGNVFLELLPEVIERRGGLDASSALLILAGIVVFFVLENAVRQWQAAHGWTHEHAAHVAHIGARTDDAPHGHAETLLQARPFAVVNLGGDIAHNFIDGLAVGAAFMADTRLGFATSLAVILHEIPQELGDFAVLVQAGLSRNRALLYNFLTALSAVAGGAGALLLGEVTELLPLYLIPFTAGTFIYLALADLIPELQAHARGRQAVYGVAGLLAGIGLMYLLQLTHHAH